MCVFSAYHKDEQDSGIFGCDEDYRNVLCVCFQRIIKMNKTEDDELDAGELTAEELKVVAGILI